MSEFNLPLLQSQHPEIYPPYLNELENQYLHLYQHLMSMKKFENRNQRVLEIKKIPPKESSVIISEVKESIINKVKSNIPENHLNIYFILGATGSGKSTLLCFLRGERLELVNFGRNYSDKNNLISHDPFQSHTFLPEFGKVGERLFIEFPGFNESNGELIHQGTKLALQELISTYNPKFIIVESIDNVYNSYKIKSELNNLKIDLGKCILFLNKYTINSYYLDTKNETKLSDANLKYLKMRELNIIEDLKIYKLCDELGDIILRNENELSEIIKEREIRLNKLSETTIKNQKYLEKIELSIVEQIGISKFIRLVDLEKPNTRELCLEKLDTFDTKIWKNNMIPIIQKD